MKSARLVAVTVGVVSLALVTVLATREPAVTRVTQSPLVGKLAPPVVGADIIRGGTARLSSLRGRFVLLNFFATWCVPCQREHAVIREFAQRNRNDAAVLMVIFDDSAADAKTWLTERGADWAVIDDPDGKVALDFGVRGPPESFLIAPDGTVLHRVVGELDGPGLAALLDAARR